MKHREIIYVRRKSNYFKWVAVQFRYDPIPTYNHKRSTFYCYYKRPKSTQERRLSYAYGSYVRGRRRDGHLPDAWDDYKRSDIRTRKSWKNKKIRKQWMKNYSK